MTYHQCSECEHYHAEKTHTVRSYRIVLHLDGTQEGVAQLLQDVAGTLDDYGLGENAITSYRFEVEGGDRDVTLPGDKRVKTAYVAGERPPTGRGA